MNLKIFKVEVLWTDRENKSPDLTYKDSILAAIGMKVKGHLKGDGSDVVVVSGAAGATGSVAGQIAKNRKAKKVIGICGSDEKCDFIKSIGFTHAVSKKSSQF